MLCNFRVAIRSQPRAYWERKTSGISLSIITSSKSGFSEVNLHTSERGFPEYSVFKYSDEVLSYQISWSCALGLCRVCTVRCVTWSWLSWLEHWLRGKSCSRLKWHRQFSIVHSLDLFTIYMFVFAYRCTSCIYIVFLTKWKFFCDWATFLTIYKQT